MTKLRLLTVILTVPVIASACSGAGRPAPEASQTISPEVRTAPAPHLALLQEATAPTDPSECIVVTHDVEPIPLDDVGLAGEAAVVVEAQISGSPGKAMWNTPGGVRPKMGDLREPTPVLYSPQKIKSVDPLRGNVVVDRVMLPGGTNGCDSGTYSNQLAPMLVEGETYLFFLNPVVDTAGAKLDDVAIMRAWKKQADDTFTTDTGEKRTRTDVEDSLAENPKK